MALTTSESYASDVDPSIYLAPVANLHAERDAERLETRLQTHFDPQRLHAICDLFLRGGAKDPDDIDPLTKDPRSVNLWNLIDGKEYVVGLLGPRSRHKDIALAVETQRFAQQFNRSLGEVYTEYDAYSDTSQLLVVIDVRDPDYLKPAGAMRIVEHGPKKLQKSIADLVTDVDNPEQYPWHDDLRALGILATNPRPGENEPHAVWERFCKYFGVTIKPEDTLDIATVANMPEYGADGSLDGVSMLLYHSCLRYMMAHRKRHLMSIQDLRPLEILQRFGSPFDSFPGLPDHPYGGPYPTRPAYATYPEGLERIRNSDPEGLNGKVFIEGFLINEKALLLSHQMGRYANEAVGLGPEVYLSAL